jgi:hypothetical protein
LLLIESLLLLLLLLLIAPPLVPVRSMPFSHWPAAASIQ